MNSLREPNKQVTRKLSKTRLLLHSCMPHLASQPCAEDIRALTVASTTASSNLLCNSSSESQTCETCSHGRSPSSCSGAATSSGFEPVECTTNTTAASRASSSMGAWGRSPGTTCRCAREIAPTAAAKLPVASKSTQCLSVSLACDSKS